MLNITFILCRQMLATSVSLPLEQLKAAQAQAYSETPKNMRAGQATLNIKLASLDGEPVKTHTGLVFTPDASALDINNSDIIYLPALWRNPRPVLAQNAALLPWLRQQAKKGVLIAGVGTGCYLMAEAGLLDNKAATTHWHYFDQFKKRYPKVNLKQEYFITQADNLFCAGSINSLADLTIHFIQRHFSPDVASNVERHFFHEIRRAYDSSVFYQEIVKAHPDEDIVRMQTWLNDNHSKDVKMQDLAKQFGMSIRTFNRRFKNATGISPLNYLQKIRMEIAKDLLQTTNLSISEMMYKVGYHDIAHFNTLFKKHHGTTPGQYRTTVRAKLFTLNN
ncbi:GlxA family transcriptional regulator [Agarilytica rhodophyticola]|uniref:GlxA family transcriptional regulator n=1 Tax=Agarilytica rhodophyticola TaxID=1737490 RepID=UPI000B349FDD|nr:helix-turn-helix domain-containing protein [Agarilytica rhodophyticola]